MLHQDVSLNEIAALTKNFSGAELAGLVGAAQSCAFVRHTKVGDSVVSGVDYALTDDGFKSKCFSIDFKNLKSRSNRMHFTILSTFFQN